MRVLPLAALCAVMLATVSDDVSAQEAKTKVLIVTGFDVGAHKWRETTALTKTILEKTGRFDVEVADDLKAFESGLDKYDVVLLNYGFWNHPDPSEKGKAGLLDYVKGGGGLVAVHFASSSFQDWDEYHKLLGRWWKKGTGGHGPRGSFTVVIKSSDHPITEELVDFKADDELYAKLSGDEEIEVLASAKSDWSGAEEPIVFVKSYGEGRVVHNVLGHDARARSNPVFQTMLIRGVDWAADGKVTE